ncbi:MAG TPA: hypothetical protein VK538_02085, partial [Solirubrobacteraceae bacterium]|nr:hypothetical protein [Solirubrobacteraceae bacterium]
PALVAGIAVTRYGLLETANVYGAALIALALLALALSHRLQDPESPSARGAAAIAGEAAIPAEVAIPGEAALAGEAVPGAAAGSSSMAAARASRVAEQIH